jgi:hypothetical protein
MSKGLFAPLVGDADDDLATGRDDHTGPTNTASHSACVMVDCFWWRATTVVPRALAL